MVIIEINWNKTKILTTVTVCLPDQLFSTAAGNILEVIDTFTISKRSSEIEFKHRSAVARSCMTSLDKHILGTFLALNHATEHQAAALQTVHVVNSTLQLWDLNNN